MDYIKYITDGIESICKSHKRRTAGSETVKSRGTNGRRNERLC